MKTQVNTQFPISIIIVTYNSEKFINECLKSIRKQTFKDKEVLVIDNNSIDNTIKVVKKFNNVIVMKNKKNIGFAKGVNMGMRKAKYKNILLLNPDTVLKKDAIHNLVQCRLETKAGIIGGKTIRIDNSVHGSYVREPNIYTLLFDYTNLRKIIPGDYFHKRHYYSDIKNSNKNIIVDIVSGSFMLIDGNTIDKIGDLDEHFFMYLEDVDYCVRAKKDYIKTVYCPKAIALHYGGASSKNKDRINHKSWYESRSYYASKHFNVITNSLIQLVFNIDKQLTIAIKLLK